MWLQLGELMVIGFVFPRAVNVCLVESGMVPVGVTTEVFSVQVALEANWFFQVMV
jgi:hypothetical protein